MKGSTSTDWVPGIESETRGKGITRSLLFSSLVSVALFFLLPLSEFVRTEEWIVREISIWNGLHSAKISEKSSA